MAKSNNKIIIMQTYIVYVLSQKGFLQHDSESTSIRKDEAYRMYRAVFEKEVNDDTFRRYLRRYLKPLKEIGALDENARFHTSAKNNRISTLYSSYYSFVLKNLDQIKDGKDIYPIVLLLNTNDTGDRKKNIDNIIKIFKKQYPKEEIIDILFTASERIREMLEYHQLAMNDADSSEEIKEIKETFDTSRYDDIFSCVAAIKISYGYQTLKSL